MKGMVNWYWPTMRESDALPKTAKLVNSPHITFSAARFQRQINALWTLLSDTSLEEDIPEAGLASGVNWQNHSIYLQERASVNPLASLGTFLARKSKLSWRQYMEKSHTNLITFFWRTREQTDALDNCQVVAPKMNCAIHHWFPP